MEISDNFTIIDKPYSRKIGKRTFHITAFCNNNGNETASRMILSLLENKILSNSNNDECGNPESM